MATIPPKTLVKTKKTLPGLSAANEVKPSTITTNIPNKSDSTKDADRYKAAVTGAEALLSNTVASGEIPHTLKGLSDTVVSNPSDKKSFLELEAAYLEAEEIHAFILEMKKQLQAKKDLYEKATAGAGVTTNASPNVAANATAAAEATTALSAIAALEVQAKAKVDSYKSNYLVKAINAAVQEEAKVDTKAAVDIAKDLDTATVAPSSTAEKINKSVTKITTGGSGGAPLDLKAAETEYSTVLETEMIAARKAAAEATAAFKRLEAKNTGFTDPGKTEKQAALNAQLTAAKTAEAAAQASLAKLETTHKQATDVIRDLQVADAKRLSGEATTAAEAAEKAALRSEQAQEMAKLAEKRLAALQFQPDTAAIIKERTTLVAEINHQHTAATDAQKEAQKQIALYDSKISEAGAAMTAAEFWNGGGSPKSGVSAVTLLTPKELTEATAIKTGGRLAQTSPSVTAIRNFTQLANDQTVHIKTIAIVQLAVPTLTTKPKSSSITAQIRAAKNDSIIKGNLAIRAQKEAQDQRNILLAIEERLDEAQQNLDQAIRRRSGTSKIAELTGIRDGIKKEVADQLIVKNQAQDEARAAIEDFKSTRDTVQTLEGKAVKERWAIISLFTRVVPAIIDFAVAAPILGAVMGMWGSFTKFGILQGAEGLDDFTKNNRTFQMARTLFDNNPIGRILSFPGSFFSQFTDDPKNSAWNYIGLKGVFIAASFIAHTVVSLVYGAVRGALGAMWESLFPRGISEGFSSVEMFTGAKAGLFMDQTIEREGFMTNPIKNPSDRFEEIIRKGEKVEAREAREIGERIEMIDTRVDIVDLRAEQSMEQRKHLGQLQQQKALLLSKQRRGSLMDDADGPDEPTTGPTAKTGKKAKSST